MRLSLCVGPQLRTAQRRVSPADAGWDPRARARTADGDRGTSLRSAPAGGLGLHTAWRQQRNGASSSAVVTASKARVPEQKPKLHGFHDLPQQSPRVSSTIF